MNTVYDASVVALSNGDLQGRRKGNVIDRRLSVLEDFISGRRIAWYNPRLLSEYKSHTKTVRNDVITSFFGCLADHGRFTKRNKLSAHNFAASLDIGWPSHDQHLLAAALEAKRCTIFVTETRLINCCDGISRTFRIRVAKP